MKAGGPLGHRQSGSWESLSAGDFGVLGLVGSLQALAFLVCIHLVWWRKWPPYVTKNVDMVVTSTVSGILWTIATAISFGFIRREAGDILATCNVEEFVAWSTLSVHTASFFIRVYRMWRILIKHDDKMWRMGFQVLILSSGRLLPIAVTWGAPARSTKFNAKRDLCMPNPFTVLSMNAIGFIGILFLWFVCARQLKSVRKQFNEYETLRRTLLGMTITMTGFGLAIFLLVDNNVQQRRVAIIYPVVTTYILLWGSIHEPFLKKMRGDKEYLWSFTKGFAELPSPAQLKASLAEQLSVEQLRDEFRRYIKTKVAQELVDFYLDSLDREEVTGYFKRQAITMRIIQTYIREGAPDQVNISEDCRNNILGTDVTEYDIFDEARKEVLDVMQTNFQRDFVATEGFQRIQDASEREQRELRFLRAGGMLPVGTPSTLSPAAEKPTAPSSPFSAGNRRASGPPPFRGGLMSAVRKFPSLVTSSKATSEDHQRRHHGDGDEAGGGANTGGASEGPLWPASDTGEWKDPESATESSGIAVVAHELQKEQITTFPDERHVLRSNVGGAVDTWHVETGAWWATASRFGLFGNGYGEHGNRARQTRPASMPAAGRSTRGGGTDRRGSTSALALGNWWESLTGGAADGEEDAAFCHSNPMFRCAFYCGGSGSRPFDSKQSGSSSSSSENGNPAPLPRIGPFAVRETVDGPTPQHEDGAAAVAGRSEDFTHVAEV